LAIRIFALQARALEMVHRLYPDPESALLAGILLGVESGIPPDVQRAFKDTGTAHIIAISGFNITIIAALCIKVFTRLLGGQRRFLAAVFSLVVISLYTLLVGANAAVVRAAIMGGLTLFARQIGRRQQGLNSLGLVAAVMALKDPDILWDVGFQLSFAATLGLVLYAEPLTQMFIRLAGRFLAPETSRRLAGPAGEYLLFTLAAQLTTLPVTVYHFRQFSLISILANPFILPVQPAVMVLGGLAVIAGLFYYPLGKALAAFAWPFAAYTIRAVELFASTPGGVFHLGAVAFIWVAGFYLVLFVWTFWGRQIGNWISARWGGERAEVMPVWRPAAPGAAALMLLLVNVLVWQAAASRPDGRLHLTVFPVGAGEGLLIISPTGRHVLVNGGPSGVRLSAALGRRLSLFQRQLDYWVIAAPGEEGVAALPGLVERFRPAAVLWAGATHGSRAARYLQRTLAEKGIRPIPALAGQRLALGAGAELRVLGVSRRGAVLLLAWQQFRMLLPLGMDFELLETLLDDPGMEPVTALLLADSGYAPLNPPAWIAKLHPQVVLLSVAAGDPRGLPSPETLAAVDGYPLLRTDQHGWINLSTDGEQLWVTVERK